MKTFLSWIKNNARLLVLLVILSSFLFAFSKIATTKVVIVKADEEKEVVIIGNPKNIKVTNKK